MSNTYRLTIAIRKRNDLERPTSEAEAIMLVHDLLSNGSFIDVLSVTPEVGTTKDDTVWR